jgi:hypothetical protein
VVSFNSGGSAPADTTPLPALAPQFPMNRLAEPSRIDGARTRNPRDALVTVLVYVIGEEHYDDNNGNGLHDANEPFVDQGEPFVDFNDNDVWDPGEFFMNDVDNNGMWTPPNGIWDSAANNHLVWTEAKILLTSNAEPSIGTIEGPIPALCPGGLGKGVSVDFDVYAPDLNLNRVEASSAMQLNRAGSKGTLTLGNNTLLDGFGFQFERVLVDANTVTQACTATTPRCIWRNSFGSWDRGFVNRIRATGAPVTDMTPCADETSLSVTTTVRGTPVPTNSISFGVQ